MMSGKQEKRISEKRREKKKKRAKKMMEKKRAEMPALKRERRVIRRKEVDPKRDVDPKNVKYEEVDQRKGKREEKIVITSSRTLNTKKREKRRKREVSPGKSPSLDIPVTSPTERQQEPDRTECTVGAMTDEGVEGTTGEETITIGGGMMGTEVGTEGTAGRGIALEEVAERGEETVGTDLQRIEGGLLKGDAGSAVLRQGEEVLRKDVDPLRKEAAVEPQRRET